MTLPLTLVAMGGSLSCIRFQRAAARRRGASADRARRRSRRGRACCAAPRGEQVADDAALVLGSRVRRTAPDRARRRPATAAPRGTRSVGRRNARPGSSSGRGSPAGGGQNLAQAAAVERCGPVVERAAATKRGSVSRESGEQLRAVGVELGRRVHGVPEPREAAPLRMRVERVADGAAQVDADERAGCGSSG